MVHGIRERKGINQILFFCHLHTQLCRLAKNGVLLGPYNVSVIEERDWGSAHKLCKLNITNQTSEVQIEEVHVNMNWLAS